MKLSKINDQFTVSDQIAVSDLSEIAQQGFKTIYCNRPDGESSDQPNFEEIDRAAKEIGLKINYLPVTMDKISDDDIAQFSSSFEQAAKPVLSYCRSGMRSLTLWSLKEAEHTPLPELLSIGKSAGFNMSGLSLRLASGKQMPSNTKSHQIVIVGGGAAGISAASSLLARDSSLDIAIIDPAETHCYQPGWTMVGGGIFTAEQTVKTMASVMPKNVTWIKAAVEAFEPEQNMLIIEGYRLVKYEKLIVCPGVKLNWNGIEGLVETLGQNGVTSNYRYDLAPYTWELVSSMRKGKAIFTQPPMPIKCAGAPQKAMYLSGDHWFRSGDLKNIDIDFYTSTPGLFGVKEYVPPLMEYVEKYNANLHFTHTLTKIDGPKKLAWFSKKLEDGSVETIETNFDMIHVVPPQQAPDFIKASTIVDEAGWVDVSSETLQHKRYPDIYGLGDVINAPNAKTAAAARKQAPVVATNILFDLKKSSNKAIYNGYGSCPLTVERGKVILAEFGYGGKLLPSFPTWLLNGQKPTKLAWILKETILPRMYWKGMLKGREWLANPDDNV